MRRAGILVAALALAGAAHAQKERVDALFARASALDAVEVHPEQRLAARRELVRLGARAAPFLVAHLPTVQAQELVELIAVLRAMRRAALPALAPAIASRDDRTREQAVLIWCDIRDRSMRPDLLRLLDDPLPRVRAMAALGMAGLAEHPTVLTQTARGLRFLALKVPGAVPAGTVARLVALLDHPHRGVREASLTALEEVGAAALPALQASIARTSRAGPPLWNAALAFGTILGEHPEARSGAALAVEDALLAHPDASVRLQAVAALAAWGGAGRTRALAILHGEPSPAVRQQIMQLASTRPSARPPTL